MELVVTLKAVGNELPIRGIFQGPHRGNSGRDLLGWLPMLGLTLDGLVLTMRRGPYWRSVIDLVRPVLVLVWLRLNSVGLVCFEEEIFAGQVFFLSGE